MTVITSHLFFCFFFFKNIVLLISNLRGWFWWWDGPAIMFKEAHISLIALQEKFFIMCNVHRVVLFLCHLALPRISLLFGLKFLFYDLSSGSFKCMLWPCNEQIVIIIIVIITFLGNTDTEKANAIVHICFVH